MNPYLYLHMDCVQESQHRRQLMEEFFHIDFGWNYDLPGEVEVEPSTGTSAFLPYVQTMAEERLPNGEGRNVNKRVLGFLRKESDRSVEFERKRGLRHMLSERSRRERQKQSYDALLLQLPHATKNDKNSIVRAATKEILQLNGEREELVRRYREMNGEEDTSRRVATTSIKVLVMNPTSGTGTDSLVTVLKCLQNQGVKTIAVRAELEFSSGELSAVIEIENERIESAELEKVIQSALHEAGGTVSGSMVITDYH